MSVESIALVLHHSRAQGTTKLVLVGIANHDGDGGAWPSVATLAKYAGKSERQVQRAIRELVALGELAVYVQEGGRAKMHDALRPNRYEVLVSCPPECDRTKQHKLKPPTKPAVPSLGITPDDRVTPMSPGDTHVTPPVTPMSPHPVTPTSPEPSLEPPSTSGCSPQVTTDRAREGRAHGTPPPAGLLDEVRRLPR